MHKKTLLGLVTLLLFCNLQAQRKNLVRPAVTQFQVLEEGMKDFASAILNARETEDRFRADSLFTRRLVQALRIPYSFSYGFDSLTTISRIYAPDSSFRIFTWQVMKDYTYYRQKGALQLRTKDGSLKLFPLFDFSEFTEEPVDSVRTIRNWVGAVYYNIIQKEFNKKQYYTLLGYDANNERSTKKWMEVLSFSADSMPQFGGRYFAYRNDSIKVSQPAYRFCLEFKKEANAKLNYDAEMDKIIFAHLVSEEGDVRKKHTLVPLGTYEAFKWTGGRWVHESNIAEVDPDGKINPDQGVRPRKQ